jgi:hypothetical protein
MQALHEAHFAKLWSARGEVTALGGRWNRDDAQGVMLATGEVPRARIKIREESAFPPPSQSGGSAATALQSFAKSALRCARIKCALPPGKSVPRAGSQRAP